jgi:hypothetical protein
MSAPAPALPSRLVAIVKRDCPTCELVVPVLQELASCDALTVYSQDDPTFPAGLAALDDSELSVSYHHGIEAVPTLLRVEAGREVDRAVGWHREEWEKLSGHQDLGSALPDYRPGCGSRSQDPDLLPALRARFEGERLKARRIELGPNEDVFEALHERGLSDGLPLVPPTPERVLSMLEGTQRDPSEIVATVPPDLVPCSVEKVAINAVMAGCKPEYLPVVLTAVEAVCTDEFNIHGVLATTMSVGPVLIVNGPIARRIGMNSAGNVFGQGNRANLSIGRALQLVIRNVGGGRPQEVDRATFGNPGKLAFCFAEDEENSPWTPLAADFGLEPGVDAVTVFAGEGPRTLVDQLSRDPEQLARSFAVNLRALLHPKAVMGFDALLIVGPEHASRFREAGWSKHQLLSRLKELLMIPGAELIRGAGGIAEGLPESARDAVLPKFSPTGLHIIHCGGTAGLFSAMIGGWAGGTMGSQPVTREIRS